MSGKLKIYACSGIGAVEAKKRVGYWLDNTNTLSNTQAVNTLLARINEKYIAATRLAGISKQDKIALLNDVDLLQVSLEAAKRFKGSDEQLRHAGEVICEMWQQGAFKYDVLDARKREDHLEELLGKFDEAVADTTPVQNTDQAFMDWWQQTVVSRNKLGLNFGQEQLARKALKQSAQQIKGIGKVDWSQYQNGDWMENPDLAKYLTDGATYFIYTYFTDEQVKQLPTVFQTKRLRQKETYAYCLQMFVDVYGSEQDMQRIIRAGIIDAMEVTPEEFCAGVLEGKIKPTEGIGFAFLGLVGGEAVKAFLTFLTIIGGILIGIVKAICDSVQNANVAKYGAIDSRAVEGGVPNESDYAGLDLGGGTLKKSGLGWLGYAVVAAVAGALIFRR